MSFDKDEGGSHLAVRIAGEVSDLGRLMVALARSVDATWVERSDEQRGTHFEIVSRDRGVALRASLAPSAILLELFAMPSGTGFVVELERRLRAVGGQTVRLSQDQRSKEMS